MAIIKMYTRNCVLKLYAKNADDTYNFIYDKKRKRFCTQKRTKADKNQYCLQQLFGQNGLFMLRRILGAYDCMIP